MIVVHSYNQLQISTVVLKHLWNAVVKKTTIRTSPVFYTLVSVTVCSHERAVYVIGPFTILRGLAYHSKCDAHLLQYQQNAGEAENNRHISKGIQMHFL